MATKTHMKRTMFGKQIKLIMHPFRELSEYTVTKLLLMLGAGWLQVLGVVELFNTPLGYVYTLIILMGFDSMSKVWRVLFNPEKKFRIIKLLKGFIYKAGIYAWLVLPFTVYSNQYDFTNIQYGIYLSLSTLELFSIARHWKIMGYLIAFAKQLRSGKLDFEELNKLAREYDILRRQEDEDD